MRWFLVGAFLFLLSPTSSAFAQGACCRPDGSCDLVTNPIVECGPGYQGDDSNCSVGLCPIPTGACCLPTVDAVCQLEEPLSCQALGGIYQSNGTTCSAVTCLAVLAPFVDRLPILPIARPTSGAAGEQASYDLSLVTLQQKLHRDLPATTVWGVDDGTTASFPGPTIEASVGNAVEIRWKNDFRDDNNSVLTSHWLDVNTCYPGAIDGPPMAAMTVSGAHASSLALGMPDNTILPSQESLSIFENLQEAATLWYHDRTRGISSLNSYMGVSGLYLLRDPDAHELPNGEHDIPLVLQDRTIDGNGQLVYPDGLETTTTHSLALVNGKVWPYLEVDRGSYRFRIVNASGGRTFRLGFSNGLPFTVIGGDLGLLPTTTTTDRVTVAPGERVEVVVDFSGLLPGAEVVLTNDAAAPFPGFENQGVIPEILKLVIGSASAPKIEVASELGTVEPLLPENAAEERTLILGRDKGECSPFTWNINSTNWGDSIIRPRLGSTEVWHIANTTRDMQPIHIDTAFQIISKSNFEFMNGDVVATDEILPLAPEEAGWKDSVRVGAGEMVSIVLAFDDFEGRLAFHSNILEHADNAMLGQYVVTTTCGDGFAGAPAEQCDDSGASAECNSDCTLALCGDGQINEAAGEVCDDGGLEAGDGCSPACQFEEPAETPDGGCGCKATGVPDASSLGGLFLLLIVVVRRRRWS